MIAALCLAAALRASPQVDALLPRGGQRGSEIAVQFLGARLADAEGVLFSSPGIELVSLAAADESRVDAKLRIAPDCRLGEQLLRLRTRSGLSKLLTFWVGPFPSVAEAEPNDFDHPQPLARNVTVEGTIASEDVDCFALDMKQGERISVEVEALRLGDAPFDAFVAILDEKRFELSSCDDSSLFRQDPVVTAIAPRDGRYVVLIRDSSFGGGDRSRYRMHVGTFPRPIALFPAGAKQGAAREIALIGDARGPFTQLVTIPPNPPSDFAVWPEQDGVPAPSPLPFRPRWYDSVAEVEPDDAPEQATRCDHPPAAGFDGVIGAPGDVDWFRLPLKKDEKLNVRVQARSLRSPLDPVLSIHAADGRQLEANDDVLGLDSYFAFTAPADGDYLLRVADHLRSGGPAFTYRVELHPVTPSLSLDVPRFGRDPQARQVAVVPRANRFAMALHAGRNQLTTALEVAAANLPAGVSMRAVPMAKNVDTTLLLFEAAADAPLDGKLVDLTTEADDPRGGAAKIRGRLRQKFDLVQIPPNETSLYEAYADRLAVAVAEEAPFELSVATPKVPLVQFGQLPLVVTAKRKPGFDAPITLRMLWLPTGVGAQPTIAIGEKQGEASYVLNANGDAELRAWQLAILGEAETPRGQVLASTPLVDVAVAPPFVSLKLDLAATEQGQHAQVVAHVAPLVPFEGKAKVSLRGLPPGASCADLDCGAAESTLIFDVATDAKTPVGKHQSLFCQVVIEKEGEAIVHFLGGGGVLRVDPPAPPATAAATPAPAAPAPAAAPAAPVAKPLSRIEQLRQEAAKRAADAAKPAGAAGGRR